MAIYGKRRDPRWWADERTRLLFERQVRSIFPDLGRVMDRDECKYAATVDLPPYEARRVQVIFHRNRSRNAPEIIADGPTDAPHRYSDNGRRTLCIWHPEDPPENRWVFEDGLLALLGLIRLHLLREAWWRETKDWAGPEAPHGNARAKEKAAA